MYAPNTPVMYRALIGKWRVVEFRIMTLEETRSLLLEMNSGSSSEDVEYRRHGILHVIVGDFDDFGDASSAVDLVRYPYRRVLFNDMGVEVLSVTPGSENQPQAGGES